MLSRDLGPDPHQVHAQFTGGLALGSLPDCKGREHRGYHRELLVPFHSCADTLRSLGDAQNYTGKMWLREAVARRLLNPKAKIRGR